MFDIERHREVLREVDLASGVSERPFTQPYKFCKDTKFRYSEERQLLFVLSEVNLKSTKRCCVQIIESQACSKILVYGEYLVEGGFFRSKATLIRFEEFVDGGIRSFT